MTEDMLRDAAPSDPDDPLVGRMLSGGLRVIDRLGSTPEGTLYRAEYPSGIEVALLILRPETGVATLSRRERLEPAIRIQHPNVAAIYEVGELKDGSLYLILEQLVGEPLSNLLAAGRAFALPEALDLALQVAAGLEAAHREGFVHGYLSPETILVTPAGGRAQVKLIRFTLDQALGPAGAAPPVYGEASAPYASPERFDGKPADERSDVYSLGAVLHHLLAGMPPESGNVAGQLRKNVRAVLATALAPVPARRFQTIPEFTAALEPLAASAGKRNRPIVRRTLMLGAVAASLVLGMVGMSLLLDFKWPAISQEHFVPVTSPAPAPAPSPPGPQTALRHEASGARKSVATESAPPPAPAPVPEPRTTPTKPIPAPVADPDTDGANETGMVATPPAEEPPPTLEERSDVFLRIGLDEARRQLGRPVHAIEGMTLLFVGLARSEFPPYADTTRPLVRSVYMGPDEKLILLDQQRLPRGARVPVATATNWRIGDVMLHLHGEARPEVLRNLVRRVR